MQVDAEMALQEIWNAKKLYEQEKQSSLHLQDFLYIFLVRSGLSDAVLQCMSATGALQCDPPPPPLSPLLLLVGG